MAIYTRTGLSKALRLPFSELRRAFAATMKDPQFIAEAAKMDLDINPVQGADMDAIVRRIAGYNAAAVQRARELGSQ